MTTLLLVVIGSILTSFESIQKTSVRETSRSEEADQLRLAMEQISKEVRQAYNVRAGSSATFLDVDTYINGVDTHISYSATGTTLNRTAKGQTLPMLERLTSTDVFSYDPSATDPAVITITLVAKPEFYQTDSGLVTLTSEVQLRNRGTTS